MKLYKIVSYKLFPEAYGSKGQFVDKIGGVGELIVDMGLLINSDFDKVIPSITLLNRLLLEGEYGRAGEWKSFELNQDGCFSNFSKHSFIIDGILYKTVEHYFQSKKLKELNLKKKLF